MTENQHRNATGGHEPPPGEPNKPFGFVLCGFAGWLLVPPLISAAYLALRSTLPIAPGVRLPTDILSAALGLGTIGLITTCPVGFALGAAAEAWARKSPADRARHRRIRLWLLLGPSAFFAGFGLLGYLVEALTRAAYS